eukprot:GHRQ01031348.1.p1 GENE.GHRQ01031348.1~~GHRQ01031348.1.p1  ORF type:complete len:194 (-),score=26.70 GHRQ01031348.1:367-948(-)
MNAASTGLSSCCSAQRQLTTATRKFILASQHRNCCLQQSIPPQSGCCLQPLSAACALVFRSIHEQDPNTTGVSCWVAWRCPNYNNPVVFPAVHKQAHAAAAAHKQLTAAVILQAACREYASGTCQCAAAHLLKHILIQFERTHKVLGNVLAIALAQQLSGFLQAATVMLVWHRTWTLSTPHHQALQLLSPSAI